MADGQVAGGFAPDWRTHPGEHLQEYLEARGWSQADFARQAGMTPKLVSEIISAKNPVSPETAMKFQRVLGLKAEIWLDLQAKWDLHQAREREAFAEGSLKAWVAQFPIWELKNRNALPNTTDNRALADGLCQFFGIGTPMAFDGLVKNMAVQHRKAKSEDVSACHVWSWLMLGEIKAAQTNLPEFSEKKFLDAVLEIRSLTTEPPQVFEPKMKQLCHQAGVAVVFEKPITKTKLFGSARWFNGDRNALIQLSLRMKSNDHFWWTFFHECGHVALHRGKNFADDQGAHGDGLEHEADSWAEELLYGDGGAKKVVESLRVPTIPAVQQCARSMKLHPGIIVGMLQHYRVISFAQLNHLKVKFEWADSKP